MLLGWHAQNGVMLNNPRLGFVCTKQTVDGQSALEGYYYEYARDLLPHERLRFAREEDAPNFDPNQAPRLPVEDWPPARLAKAHRNYAMQYVCSAFPTALQLWGPHEASHRLRMVGKMVGMQFFHAVAHALRAACSPDAAGFAHFLVNLSAAHGDEASMQTSTRSVVVRQRGWAFRDGLTQWVPELGTAWNGLIEGALQAHNPRIQMTFQVQDAETPTLIWTLND